MNWKENINKMIDLVEPFKSQNEKRLWKSNSAVVHATVGANILNNVK